MYRTAVRCAVEFVHLICSGEQISTHTLTKRRWGVMERAISPRESECNKKDMKYLLRSEDGGEASAPYASPLVSKDIVKRLRVLGHSYQVLLGIITCLVFLPVCMCVCVCD